MSLNVRDKSDTLKNFNVKGLCSFSSKKIQQSADTGYCLDIENTAALKGHRQHSEVQMK
jgi:hypothetical protein